MRELTSCNVVCYGGHSRGASGLKVRGILLELRDAMDITELLAFSAKQGASDLHLLSGPAADDQG